MEDRRKTKEELINELEELRGRISRLEAFESEHIPLETAVKHVEKEKQNIRDRLIEHVVYHDLEMRMLWANRAACNSVGMRLEELVGRHCYEIWANRTDPCEDCPVMLARETGRPQTLEKKTQDGRSWYVKGFPVVDSDGDVVGVVELTLEITERKLTEEALQKSEKQYRVLLETIPHGIQEIDLAGTITFANSAHNKIYGYSDKEMIGKSILDLQISDSEKRGLGNYLAKLVKEQPEPIPYLAKNLTKDGRLIDVQVDWNYKRDNQGHVKGFISVVTDITKQKQAEDELQKAHDGLEQRVKERTAELMKTNEQLGREIKQRKETEKDLQESQKKYRSVVENATEGIVVIQDGILKFSNPQVADFIGYSKEELFSKPFAEFIHPDDRKMVFERYVSRLRGEGVASAYPFRVIKKNGDVRWIEVKPVLTRWEGKAATLSFVTDITERKEAEDTLRQSEAQKKAILDASPDRILYVDKDMRIIWANKTARAGLNVPPEDLSGQTCHKLFVDKDTPCDGCPTLKTGETEQIERAVMYKPRITGVEGESYWDVYCSPLRSEEGVIENHIQICRNITEQKHKEAQILRQNALLEGLNKVFRETLMSCENDEEVSNAFLAIAEELTGSKFGFIAEVNGAGLFDCLAMSDPGWDASNMAISNEKKVLKNMTILGYWDRVINGKKSLIVNDSASPSDGIRKPEGHPKITSFLGTPLCHGGGTFGMIAVCNKEDGYNADDQEALETISIAIVEALKSSRAQRQIHLLSQNLMRAQENERQMISRELHDGIAQDLTVSKIELDMLLENDSALDPVSKPKVMGISHSLNKAISAVRNLSYDLRPPGLDQTHLTEAICNYCEDFSQKTGLIVNFTSAGMEEIDLNDDIKINLFRLVQEGLHNIWKHAEASHAAIKMVSVFPNIILRIEDDGKGFDVAKRLRAIKNEKRLGLRSMEERVQLLEGQIEIHSKPMKGTKIYVKIPHMDQKKWKRKKPY